jgi:hypothetical protein
MVLEWRTDQYAAIAAGPLAGLLVYELPLLTLHTA